MDISTPVQSVSIREMGEAVRAGERVLLGHPISVKREDGETVVLNLAAAHRGEPDPYFVIRQSGPLVELSTNGDRTLYVGGLPVSGGDLGAVTAALRLAPLAGTRHDPESNARRMAAGKAALRVRDSMIRARLLDAVDGWAALRESGEVVDQNPDPLVGTLIKPNEGLGLLCLVLVVRCPSTSRTYALRVPSTMKTAQEARLWTMDLKETPEVES